MNARTAVERQWAACILRRPAARHTMLKYLRAYQVPAELVQFEDERARLVWQAIVTQVHRNQPVTREAVAEYLAVHDFNLSDREASAWVGELAEGVPADVDEDRLALALLGAMGITLPEHEINDYLLDPLGVRADAMQARKTRMAR